MSELLRFIDTYQIGDVASVLGVLIAIVGFGWTIAAVWRSGRVVVKVREDVRRVNTVGEFAAAMTTMDEIRRLHREGAWPILPDRYSALKKLLISIKTASPDLLDHHKKTIQSAIQIFTGIEKKVENALAQGRPPDDVARLNNRLTEHIDALQEVLVEVRDKIGR